MSLTFPLYGSKIDVLESCPARYVFEQKRTRRDALPYEIYALFGIAFHALLDTLSPAVTVTDVSALLRQKFYNVVYDLAPDLPSLINRAFGHDDLLQVFTSSFLISKAREACKIAASPELRLGTRRRNSGAAKPLHFVNAGGTVKKTNLVTGVPDYVSITERDIYICEFKTGSILAPDDMGPRRSYWLQIMAYALMLHDEYPSKLMHIKLLGGGDAWERTLGVHEVDEFRQFLINLLVPLTGDQAISSLAKPGTICQTCSYRHKCESYRVWALSRWPNFSNVERLPSDTWGQLENAIKNRNGLYDLILRDPAGRLVRVSGITADEITLTRGAILEAYSLKSSETGRGYSHPQNFHVLDLATPQNSAFSACCYLLKDGRRVALT